MLFIVLSFSCPPFLCPRFLVRLFPLSSSFPSPFLFHSKFYLFPAIIISLSLSSLYPRSSTVFVFPFRRPFPVESLTFPCQVPYLSLSSFIPFPVKSLTFPCQVPYLSLSSFIPFPVKSLTFPCQVLYLSQSSPLPFLVYFKFSFPFLVRTNLFLFSLYTESLRCIILSSFPCPRLSLSSSFPVLVPYIFLSLRGPFQA